MFLFLFSPQEFYHLLTSQARLSSPSSSRRCCAATAVNCDDLLYGRASHNPAANCDDLLYGRASNVPALLAAVSNYDNRVAALLAPRPPSPSWATAPSPSPSPSLSLTTLATSVPCQLLLLALPRRLLLLPPLHPSPPLHVGARPHSLSL
ncbi:hypothetical protein BS78_07G038600 [Paspalum vaginatum]|nr:hypothetical protein BS78_07G038600 [Paspalum vaginatum]